ncbi:hypothetical protein BJF78_00645 [Pseudonocardia sp. CNS-139]|nr:hypothetical protein BJF78_00645 [Pseudonocardia sp. CNS-139]
MNGRRLEIVYCNERLDINEAASCARRAEGGDSIALLGTNSTNSVQGVLPYLRTIPNVGPFSLSPDDVGCPTCYAYDSLMLGQLMSTQALIQQSKITGSVQIVTLDIPAGHDSQNRAYEAMKSAGIDVKPVLFLPPTTSDMSTYAQRIKDSGAAAVVPALPNQGVFALLQALKQIDYQPIVLTNDTQVLPRDIEVLGDFIEGAKFVLSLPPAAAADRYEGVGRWVADMKAQQDTGDEAAATLNGISLHAWLGVHAIAEIAGQVDGEVTRDSFVAALKAAEDVDMQGILPPWTPTAPAPAGMPDGLNMPLVFFGTVKDNTLVLMENDPFNIASNAFQPVPAP